VLSYDQQRRLDLLAAQTSVEDPRFALGLGVGQPRRPRQYRAGQPILEIIVAIATIALAATLGVAAAVIIGAAILVGLTAAWARRRLRLDRPCASPYT
jgi:hypothetical protein